MTVSGRNTCVVITQCSDPRLRFGWRRDRDPRASGRVQRAEALLVTERHEPEAELVSISPVALGHCVRHGSDTGGPSDRNCNLESLHSHVVSLYYLQHSGIWAYVIRFHHVTKELFSSVTPFFFANLPSARSKDFTRLGFFALRNLLRPKPTATI